jgi:lipoyl(octanoyl) transferase
VRRGCSFHGLALNIDMDMEPFLRINPCGYAGLEMTQLAQLNNRVEISQVAKQLIGILCRRIGYNGAQEIEGWE